MRQNHSVSTYLMRLVSVASLLILTASLASSGNTESAPVPPHAAKALDAAGRARLAQLYERLPLRFEPNQGQAAANVRFLSRGQGYAVFFADTHADIALSGAGKSSLVRLKMDGAAPPRRIRAMEPLAGITNHFSGSDPARWRTAIPGYGRIAYDGVYPGVDLIYYGNQRRLEYDFQIAAGADPSLIRLSFEGVESKRIDSNGDLVLETPSGPLRQLKPRAYQEYDGRQVERSASYRLDPDGRVGFALAGYDAARPLIIDPVLAYSTFLGSTNGDAAFGIAVDTLGCAYITGYTLSAAFPTASPHQGANAGNLDAFVTKLTATGSALVYSTYLGGSSEDGAAAIALDSTNAAYITGYTFSTNFPTMSPVQGANAGGRDGFAAKLTPAGALAYSTYLGGTGDDRGLSIAVESTNAYVAGSTSADFPTSSAFIGAFGGGARDGFVAKLNAAGSSLVFSTYLGGNGDDQATDIAVDVAGAAFVTGFTSSTNFPLASPINGAPLGGYDAFVAKFAPAGSALTYSTYLGGGSDDRGTTIAIDITGAAYVGGWTHSPDYPKVAPFRSTFAGLYEGFVTKLNTAGSALVFSTYIGGNGEDFVAAIAVDSSNQAVVTGYTSSTDFPAVATSSGYSNGRSEGAFVTRFATTGSTVSFSTYLGGIAGDQGNAIAVDPTGAIYVAGVTNNPNFPVVSAFQSTFQGFVDGFVSKFIEGTPLTVSVTTNPAGLDVIIDGVTKTAPQFVGWTPGTPHTIGAPSPQGGGPTRHAFASWSNGGSQTQTVTAPAADTTYTATFNTQHLLNLLASPPGGGTVSSSPSSGDGYHNAGTSVQITAVPSAGYSFTGFSGDLFGTAQPQNLVMSAPRNVTALFACIYSLSQSAASFDGGANTGSFSVTTGSTCSFTATSNADWITILSGGFGLGGRLVSFQLAANPTAASRSGIITLSTGGLPQVFTVNQGPMLPASVTFTTVPAGLQVLVDGVAYSTPRTFVFTPGSSHEVGAPSPQTVGGTRSSFASWSDGGSQTHQILAPLTGVMFLNATFSSTFLLTRASNPNGSGTVTATPASGDGFYAPGTVVQLAANPATGAVFNSWSGDVSGTANPTAVTMDAPKSVTANFTPMTCGSNYSLSPQHFVAQSAGGTFTANVITGAGCFWSANLALSFINPWVSLTGPSTGAGNGSFQFTVQANTTEFPRTASINLMGQLVQIVQKGVNVAQVFTDVGPAHMFFDYITLLKRFGTTDGCSPTQYCPDTVTTRAAMAELVIRALFFNQPFPFQTAPFFTDVPPTHPQFPFIQKMRELGITDGCDPVLYCPNNPVTRGEMAVFLIRGRLGVTTPQQFTFNATPYFPADAPTTHMFFPWIQKMKDLGLTMGCGPDIYCPGAPNTLGQIAVFVIRAFNTP